MLLHEDMTLLISILISSLHLHIGNARVLLKCIYNRNYSLSTEKNKNLIVVFNNSSRGIREGREREGWVAEKVQIRWIYCNNKYDDVRYEQYD